MVLASLPDASESLLAARPVGAESSTRNFFASRISIMDRSTVVFSGPRSASDYQHFVVQNGFHGLSAARAKGSFLCVFRSTSTLHPL